MKSKSDGFYQFIIILNKDDAADLSGYLIKNDFRFNLYKEDDLMIQMIPHYEIVDAMDIKEVIENFKRQQQLKLTNHLYGLLRQHTDNLHETEMKMAKYGSLDAPVKLVNEKRQIQADIREIERRISSLPNSPELSIG